MINNTWLVLIRRAIISVFDKTGIVAFARLLADNGVVILSTGGTADLLLKKGIKVRKISDETGFPEVFSGRVKTLHPMIHGSLLYDRGNRRHVKDAKSLGMKTTDLLVVNFSPVKKIDIGGPAMVRAAAKNFQSVSVMTDPSQYRKGGPIWEEIEKYKGTALETRRILARQAFISTRDYDTKIVDEIFQRADA